MKMWTRQGLKNKTRPQKQDKASKTKQGLKNKTRQNKTRLQKQDKATKTRQDDQNKTNETTKTKDNTQPSSTRSRHYLDQSTHTTFNDRGVTDQWSTGETPTEDSESLTSGVQEDSESLTSGVQEKPQQRTVSH